MTNKLIKIINIISISLILLITCLFIRYHNLTNINNDKLISLLNNNHSEVLIYKTQCKYCQKIVPQYLAHALLTFTHHCYLINVNNNNRQLLLTKGINCVPALYHNGKYYYGNSAIKKAGF